METTEIRPEKLFSRGNPNISRKKKIVFKDKKGGESRYEASNPDTKRVCEITIDGMMFKEENKKCDYGLWVEESNRMILIELKGCNIEYAFKQIETTYNLFKIKYEKEKFHYSFRIVASRFGAPNLQERLKQYKKKGRDIQVKTKLLRERI